MTPADYLRAAKATHVESPQEFGLWAIERLRTPIWCYPVVGAPTFTVLSRWTKATMHKGRGEVVMEDTDRELRKHLPIWLSARGRVLVTGLGLGCVVRGLLIKPEVEKIIVVEIDGDIIEHVWPEFSSDPRCEIVHGDALKVQPGPQARFDFAWHDIWADRDAGQPHLQVLHAKLLNKYRPYCGPQGAWDFPRFTARMIRRKGTFEILGAPR